MSNNNSLKVLLAGAECAPFVKLGGLADVMGTLPKELNQIGADARVIMPFHSQMKGKYGAQTRHLADFNINFSGGETYVGVEELVYNEVTYYLIDNEGFFGDAVYRGGLAEGEQYAFFCPCRDRSSKPYWIYSRRHPLQ